MKALVLCFFLLGTAALAGAILMENQSGGYWWAAVFFMLTHFAYSASGDRASRAYNQKADEIRAQVYNPNNAWKKAHNRAVAIQRALAKKREELKELEQFNQSAGRIADLQAEIDELQGELDGLQN